jgi:hypothetical protein
MPPARLDPRETRTTSPAGPVIGMNHLHLVGDC